MISEMHSEPIATFDVDASPIGLNLESVWPALQRGGFRRSQMINAQVEVLLPLGRKLVRFRGFARLLTEDSVSADDRASLPTPISEARFFCFGVCTAGEAIDDYTLKNRNAGALIDSMILDAIALTGLSQVGDELGRRIFAWAEEKGLASSRAFSPGSGLWGLDNQRVVFGHLPAEPLGVRLTEHYLMRPSKSLSFAVGIGGQVKQATYPFSCEGCSQVDCAHRHSRQAEMIHSEKLASLRP